MNHSSMSTDPAAPDLSATLARLDAAADFYRAEIERLTAQAVSARGVCDSDRFADICEARDIAWTNFNFACDRAFALRASC